jgi:hypothetical protein
MRLSARKFQHETRHRDPFSFSDRSLWRRILGGRTACAARKWTAEFFGLGHVVEAMLIKSTTGEIQALWIGGHDLRKASDDEAAGAGGGSR